MQAWDCAGSQRAARIGAIGLGAWDESIRGLIAGGVPFSWNRHVGTASPLQNLTSDSGYVAGYLRALRGPVVLAGHSYGGSVITNAAAGLANVKALVYVDAVAPAPGQTTAELNGATPSGTPPRRWDSAPRLLNWTKPINQAVARVGRAPARSAADDVVVRVGSR